MSRRRRWGVRLKGEAAGAERVGGCCLPEPGVDLKENKKTKIKLVVALDGSRRVKSMQQPTKKHAPATKGVWVRRFGRWGAQGEAIRSFGDDQAGRGDKKLKLIILFTKKLFS
jgi:hypothetical protein